MPATDLAASIAAVAIPSLAALAAAVVALLGVKRQIRQKDHADRRAEWWRRFERAVEWTTSPDALLSETGYNALYTLIRSPLATRDETALAEQVALALLAQTSDNET